MPHDGNVVTELRAMVDRLAALEPTALGDGDTLIAMEREMNRLDAVRARATAAFDASCAYEEDGATSASAWLAAKCRIHSGTARRRVRLGRELRHMPHTERAWMAGDISADHVSVLASHRNPRTEAAFGDAEADLVGWAHRYSFNKFCRALRYWAMAADPDGSEDRADKDRASRRLSMAQSIDDLWFGAFQGDPVSGAVVYNELVRLEEQLFDQDWKEAKARLGHEPTKADLGRTPEQRRWDALVEMATRSRTAPEGGRRPEPLVTVLVDYDTLAGRICQLANGTVVSPGSVLRLLDAAWIERVVFDSPRRVIDVGVRRRLFEGATRRAVELRDQECFHPLCEEPAERCQIDHVEPYEFGGLTVQDNGRCACPKHNRWRYKRKRE